MEKVVYCTLSDDMSRDEDPEPNNSNKVVMFREFKEQKNYGKVREIKNNKSKNNKRINVTKKEINGKNKTSDVLHKRHKCLFCKEKGNMISHEGKYICINCYNELMDIIR